MCSEQPSGAEGAGGQSVGWLTLSESCIIAASRYCGNHCARLCKRVKAAEATGKPRSHLEARSGKVLIVFD